MRVWRAGRWGEAERAAGNNIQTASVVVSQHTVRVSSRRGLFSRVRCDYIVLLWAALPRATDSSRRLLEDCTQPSSTCLSPCSPLCPRPEPHPSGEFCFSAVWWWTLLERSQASTAAAAAAAPCNTAPLHAHPPTAKTRHRHASHPRPSYIHIHAHTTRSPPRHTHTPRTRHRRQQHTPHDPDALIAAPPILHARRRTLTRLAAAAAAITPPLASLSPSRLTVSRDLRTARVRLISSPFAQPRPSEWRQKYACSTADRPSKPLALRPVRPCNAGA